MPKLIDLRPQGRERVIGAWLAGDVIVDCGPQSCMDELLRGLGDVRPRAVALTHIHLDHAGAAGSLVERWPDLEVWVHERGAPHLVDPSRLLASATRLYGDAMQTLWGDFVAVPERNLRVLRGGEELDNGFRVAYTPGHASHHVSYFDGTTAFAGDTAAVRIEGSAYIVAPTPPPDIDLPLWRESVEVIRGFGARQLALTHFGGFADVDEHLDRVLETLTISEERARDLDSGGYCDWLAGDIAAAPGTDAAAYSQAVSPAQSWLGLQRWLESATA